MYGYDIPQEKVIITVTTTIPFNVMFLNSLNPYFFFPSKYVLSEHMIRIDIIIFTHNIYLYMKERDNFFN